MKNSLMVLSVLTLMHSMAHAQWGDGGYFGKTHVNVGTQNIVVQPSRLSVPLVGLENRSDTPARCRATFSNGAQFSETRTTTVAPGKRATLAYPVHYITSHVDIAVVCSQRPAR